MSTKILSILCMTLILECAVVNGFTVGGGKCTRNIECGVPASNLGSLREEAQSATGECNLETGTCECQGAFVCPYCNTADNSSVATLGLCDRNWGRGNCLHDRDCVQGYCIRDRNAIMTGPGRCVCNPNYLCDYCTMSTGDLARNGTATCNTFTSGGGTCSSKADCGGENHGNCEFGQCKCVAGFGCADCTLSINDILSGTAECECRHSCGVNGLCENGECRCLGAYSGAQCNILPCTNIDCGPHGSCDNALKIWPGKCQCVSGYVGPTCKCSAACVNGECDTDGVCNCFDGWSGENCESHKCDGVVCFNGLCNSEGLCDCDPGYFGKQCENKKGSCDSDFDCFNHGECVAGFCVCDDGYTCGFCEGLGATCTTASGGAACGVDDDCSKHGKCLMNACQCEKGYHCPDCSLNYPATREAECPTNHYYPTSGALPTTSSYFMGLLLPLGVVLYLKTTS